MAASRDDASSEPAASGAAAAPAGELKFSVACPKCHVQGLIRWSQLKSGIRCPKCSEQFLIGRTGQMVPLADQPQTRFTCPRCGKSGSVPSNLGIRRALCGACKLPLAAGPDQRLHSEKEADELNRAAARDQASYASWLKSNAQANQARTRRLQIALASVLLLALLAVAIPLLAAAFDQSPAKRARQFTSACLYGDPRAVKRYVADDDVQFAELERFRLRHFTSIQNKFRPAGDKVRLQTQIVRETENEQVLRVELVSEFLGTRHSTQVWKQSDAGWVFDAVATLAAEDGTARRPTTNRAMPDRPATSAKSVQ